MQENWSIWIVLDFQTQELNFQWPWFENMYLVNETEKQFVVMLVQLL